MSYRQTFLASVAVCMTAALVACGGGSSSTGGGGGGTNPITVTLSGAPATLPANTTAPITATVANDSANNGVSWSCAPANACGTFSAPTTPSGTAVTYTAPASATSVTITATAVTDRTKTGTATITITAPPIALADGNYVFSLSGMDVAGGPQAYFVTGVFTVAGGLITGGEQDFVDNTTATLHDTLSSASTFTTTADGNLQIVLTTCLALDCTQVDPVVGGGTGLETINGTLVSATRARLVEFDASATSSGTLELQDTTAAATAPTGPYAFAVQGIAGGQLSIAGILNVSGATLSTTGTIFDLNASGNTFAAQTITAGSVLSPDATGRMTFSLTPSNSGSIGAMNFVGYIVDAIHIRLVEGSDQLGGTTGGVALAQNTANLSVSDNSYVVGMSGFHTFLPFQAAGLLTTTSGGTVTGTITYNDLLNAQSPAVAIAAGTYVADTTNLGRVTLTGVTDGVFTFNIQLYVDGNGNALAITLDTAQDVLEGVGYQQTAGASFSGTYVMDATGFDDSTNEFELDAVGPITADGTSSFSGFADLNWLSSTTAAVPTPNLTVTGAFTAPSGGVSTGTGNTITGLDVSLGTAQADSFDYYVVDSNNVIAIENDSNQLTLGYFELTQ